MKKLILVCIMIMLCSCTVEDEKVIRILESQGMTDVHTTGYKAFACGENDKFNTGFTAKSPNGKTVSGVVCSGFFKGATVRYD